MRDFSASLRAVELSEQEAVEMADFYVGAEGLGGLLDAIVARGMPQAIIKTSCIDEEI